LDQINQRKMRTAFRQWRSFVNERNTTMSNLNSRRDFLKLAPVASAAFAGVAALSAAPSASAQEPVSADLQSLIQNYEALQRKRDRIGAKIGKISSHPDIRTPATITLAEVVKCPDMFPASLLSREIRHDTDLEYIFEKASQLANFDTRAPFFGDSSGFDRDAWHDGFLAAIDLLKKRQQERQQRKIDSGLLAAEARDEEFCSQMSDLRAAIGAFVCASQADIQAKVSFATTHLENVYQRSGEVGEVREYLDFIKTLRVGDQKLAS
jgi:hypothetical protein